MENMYRAMIIFWLTCLVGYPRTSAPEPQNPEFKEIHSKMKFVKLSVNNKPITKKYGLKVIGTGDDILSLDVFHLKDEDKELAWGWYAVTPFTKEIPEVFQEEIEPNRGIRLRKNNIQIGDAKLLQKSEMRKDIVIELSYKGFS